MNRLLYSFLLTCCLTCVAGFTLYAQEGVPAIAIDEACRQATATQKSVAVEVFSFKSVESKILRDRILNQPEVKKFLADSFVFTSVELEKNTQFGKAYGVTQVPVVIIIKPDGSEVDRMGARGVTIDEFLAFLKTGAEGKSAISSLVQGAKGQDASIEARLSLARAYLKRQQVSEALREFVWCLDHAKDDGPKAFRKNAISAIRGLSILGANNTEATARLRAYQEQLTAQVRSNPTHDDMAVLFSVNTVLKQSERNVDLYLALPERSALRTPLFPAVSVDLLKRRAYAAIVSSVDLEAYVDQVASMLNVPKTEACDASSHSDAEGANTAHKHHHHGGLTAEQIEAHKKILAERTALAVESLLAVNQTEKARRIAGRVLELENGRLLRVKLVEAVQRSGATDSETFGAWIKSYNLPQNEDAKTAPAAVSSKK